MTDEETVTIRVRTEHGEEQSQSLAVIRHKTGVSVVDTDCWGCFGVNLDAAIDELCGHRRWTLIPESRVDRALRLHAAYVAARAALLDTTTAFTDAEWREYIERQGR